MSCFGTSSGLSLMCVLLSPYLGSGNIKAKDLTHWVKVVEVCDGFRAMREQEDQRDGRRTAAGSSRDEQAAAAIKPCTLHLRRSRQQPVWRGRSRNEKVMSGESLFTSAVPNNAII